MALYSDSALWAIVQDIIKTNGQQAITGEVHQGLLKHFIDSKANKAEVAPASFTRLIKPADLDGNFSINLSHNLSCAVPDVVMYNHEGYRIGPAHFDIQIVNANNLKIIFPEAIAGNHKCVIKYTVEDVLEAPPDYLEYETEDFTTWEGTHPNSNPVGWTVETDTPPLDSIAHYVENESGNGVAAFFSAYSYVNAGSPYIRLVHPKYLKTGETYRVTFDVISDNNQQVQISNGSGFITMAIADTYGVYAQKEIVFEADADAPFYIGAAVPGVGQTMDVKIDNLEITKFG